MYMNIIILLHKLQCAPFQFSTKAKLFQEATFFHHHIYLPAEYSNGHFGFVYLLQVSENDDEKRCLLNNLALHKYNNFLRWFLRPNSKSNIDTRRISTCKFIYIRGCSQTTFTRRGRQVVQIFPLFVNVHTIENVNTGGQVVKKKPKSCQRSL